MYLALDAARCCVDAVARDWVCGVDHGPMWGPKVLAAKWQATVAASGAWTRPARWSAARPTAAGQNWNGCHGTCGPPASTPVPTRSPTRRSARHCSA